MGKWIAIEDEQPQTDGQYLCFIKDTWTPCQYGVFYWISSDSKWCCGQAFCSIDGITHWMKLPAPPEQ